jgi:hypothetical protein
MNLQLLLLCQVLVKHNVIGSVNTPYPFTSLAPLFKKQQYFFHPFDSQILIGSDVKLEHILNSLRVESFPTLAVINITQCGLFSTAKIEKTGSNSWAWEK